MIPSFNIQPGESPTATAERRKIAMLLMKQGMDTSPIQHWTQGAARVAQAMMGGMELAAADRNERAAGKKLADALVPEMAAVTPAAPASATSAVQRVAAAMPSAGITSPQSAPIKDVYEANEQSPLDPVPGAITPDRARLIAAIQAGESGGKPNVMYGGKTFESYADHPRQPQPILSGPNKGKVSTAAGLNQMIAPTWDRAQQALNLPDFSPGNQNAAAAYIAGDDYQKRTGGNLDLALAQAGNDPAKLAEIGRTLAPTWTSLPGGIEPNAQTNQFVRNMQAPATDFSAQRAQPAQPSAAPPAAAPAAARNAPQIPAELQARLRALIMDPSTREYGLQIASQYMKPSQATFGVIGKDQFGTEQYGWIDPLARTTTPAQASGGPGAAGTAAPIVTGPGGKQIPVPPGVDPKKFRDVVTTETADAAAGKLTESQGKAQQFAGRMETAEGQIGAVEHEGTQAGQRAWAAADSALGAAGFGFPRNQLSEGYKTFDTARGQWITALLRRESGAAISPQEFQRYDREFFPQPGDGPAQIAQKREARRVAVENMKKEAGGSYQSPQAAQRGPQVGAVEDGYRFKGGNPADPNAWERVQ